MLAGTSRGRHCGGVNEFGELFHAAEPDEWAAAQATGVYSRSTLGHGLDEVGFVHCSFADQIQDVLDALFGQAPGVVLRRIDPDRLDAPVKVEDLDGLGVDYPHVYGPIPTSAVVEARPLRREAGRWQAHPGAEPRP